ncbi:alpha/beta fold hydrolase [Frankia sp. Mgl5]|uniref:alpha/beta hydrolase family esterase n=1 Tax=Frankia sp. Mgl5 TaxID=2933793 RepID=UPI002010AC5A|nr:alpha/beta fold hydrolase [Frankia sp. Mgl5]MCK9931501.1 alpha/beta fold hydrolase [Frankia sp. Mgl5]
MAGKSGDRWISRILCATAALACLTACAAGGGRPAEPGSAGAVTPGSSAQSPPAQPAPGRAAAPAGAAAASTAGCAADPATAPAVGPRHLSHDAAERTYLLALPTGYDGRTPAPVVVDFHGFKASKETQEARSGMGRLGADRGFVVVTPDALGEPRRWNTPAAPEAADDFGFVAALLDDLGAHLCLDPGRVYAVGHSNGAEFAAALVCRQAPRFAGVAMVSSTSLATCPPGAAPATMAVHGTADPSVPYAGGVISGSTTRVPAATQVIDEYARRYACAPAVLRTVAGMGVERMRHTGCAGGAEVVLDTVVGGTHAWPSSPDALADRADSPAGRSYQATAAILDFFAGH